MTKISLNELPTFIGKDLGCSDWLLIDQDRINLFADCTEDHQFIHVNEDRAKKETPFGGTIAHGFLSLSLLSKLSYGVALELENVKMSINYGFEKIRFIHPVPSSSKVRAHFSKGYKIVNLYPQIYGTKLVYKYFQLFLKRLNETDVRSIMFL